MPRRVHYAILLVGLLVFGFQSIGCNGGATTPQKALQSYADAVEKGDGTAAYKLMNQEYQERVEREKFEGDFVGSPKAAESLRKATDEGATIAATLPFTDFDTVALQLTNSGWIITGGLYHFYGQRTPRETLLSFIKATERRKYAVLMRFIPNEYKQHMSEEMLQKQFEEKPAEIDDMVARLKANQDARINVQGDRAYMKYDDYQVDFVKEGGLWKIEDPD